VEFPVSVIQLAKEGELGKYDWPKEGGSPPYFNRLTVRYHSDMQVPRSPHPAAAGTLGYVMPTFPAESLSMSLELFNRLERRFGDPYGGKSRRDLLKAALAAAGGMLLCESVARPAQAGKAGRVVVIGAGLGGLSAAVELASVGYDVMVVEPRDWLGGRVHTTDRFIRNKPIELGGEMIGLNHPTWIAYAKFFGLKLLPIPHEVDAAAPIVLGGERLENSRAKALWKELREGLSKFNYDAERIIDPFEPWKGAGNKDLDRRTTAEWIDKLSASDLCKRVMNVQLSTLNGVATDRQSYLGNLAMIKGGGVEKFWTQSEALHCDGGNQQLPEEISDELGPPRFILHHSVKAVKMGERTATVSVSDGQKLEADDVILAIPPSAWKGIEFDPPLPADLMPQMGLNTKFHSAVKTRFWEQSSSSSRSLSDAPAFTTWEDAANLPEEGGVCLTTFAGGPAAEQAIGWSAEERQANYSKALESALPGFGKEFVKARFTNWHADPYTGASYSFPAPGEVTTLGPRLQEGLGKLHFAGEHCCPAFVGYMEGALQSGLRLAKKLAKRDGVIK